MKMKSTMIRVVAAAVAVLASGATWAADGSDEGRALRESWARGEGSEFSPATPGVDTSASNKAPGNDDDAQGAGSGSSRSQSAVTDSQQDSERYDQPRDGQPIGE
jgi:hypothetical protein